LTGLPEGGDFMEEAFEERTENESGTLPESSGSLEESRGDSFVATLPPESVDELCALFNCTRESLAVILSSTSGDPAQIIALVKSLTLAYIAIKLRFETRKSGEMSGAACIIAHGSTGEFLDMTLWVSAKDLPENFDISADWESVRNGIQKIGNTPDRTLFPKILKLLKEIFNPTAVNMLFKTPSSKTDIISSLERAFSSLYHNDTVFELKTEAFNKVRLELAGLSETREPPAEEEDPDSFRSIAAIGTAQIHCKALLDPVKGKAVSDLVPGDLLVVELEKTGGLSGIIMKMLDRAGQNPVFPVLSVEKLPSGQSLVKLSISRGIEGIVRIGADMKLKTASRFSLAPGNKKSVGIAGKMAVGLLLFLGAVMLLYWLFRG